MSSAKAGALALSAVTAIYLFLMTNQAITLLSLDNGIAKTMGAVLLGLPAVGVWSIIRELKFGLQVERLVKQVKAENVWPNFEFELMPSGRPVRASAEAVFAEWAQATEKNPNDWHNWFNLSLAYDAARDSRRARSAMRMAIGLAGPLAAKQPA